VKSMAQLTAAVCCVTAVGAFGQIFAAPGQAAEAVRALPGIIAAPDGSLLASREDNNAVLRIDKDDRASIFLAGVAVGSLSVDRQGRLFAVRRIALPGTPAATQPSAPHRSSLCRRRPEDTLRGSASRDRWTRTPDDGPNRLPNSHAGPGPPARSK
jgi:hypothetical protein